MCLSTSVSFTASGMLLAGGGYVSYKAWITNKKYLPVVVIPIFAGLQQFTEGSVWTGMTAGDPVTVLWNTLEFFFFTWFMWPFWIPLSVYVLEPPESRRKHLFLIFSLIGLGFGLTLIGVVVVDYLFLSYAYISFFYLLVGLATLHLIYIISRNKCSRECPRTVQIKQSFPRDSRLHRKRAIRLRGSTHGFRVAAKIASDLYKDRHLIAHDF